GALAGVGLGTLALAGVVAAWSAPDSPVFGWLWLLGVIGTAIGCGLGLRWRRRDLALASVAFAIALTAGLLGVDELPLGLHGDEAQQVLVVERLGSAGLAHLFRDHGWNIPGAAFLWDVPWVTLLGPTVVAVRLGSAVAGALTVAVVYLWGR